MLKNLIWGPRLSCEKRIQKWKDMTPKSLKSIRWMKITNTRQDMISTKRKVKGLRGSHGGLWRMVRTLRMNSKGWQVGQTEQHKQSHRGEKEHTGHAWSIESSLVILKLRIREWDQWKIELERKIRTRTETALYVMPRNLELMLKQWGGHWRLWRKRMLWSGHALEKLFRYLCMRKYEEGKKLKQEEHLEYCL